MAAPNSVAFEATAGTALYSVPYPAAVELAPDALVENYPVHTAEGVTPVPGSAERVHWTLSVAEGSQHHTLNGITHGYGGTEKTHNVLRDSMAGLYGEPTYTFQPAREGEDGFRHPERLTADTIATVTEAILLSEAVLDLPGGDKLDVTKQRQIPHSMGSRGAILYALENPNDIELITYLEAVGAEPHVGLWGFAKRLPATARHDFIPSILSSGIRANGNILSILNDERHYFFDSLPRTVGEARGCMQADILPDVMLLTKLGILQAMLYGKYDKLVPAQPAVDHLAPFVDYHEIADFNHVAPQAEGARVAGRLVSIARYAIDKANTDLAA